MLFRGSLRRGWTSQASHLLCGGLCECPDYPTRSWEGCRSFDALARVWARDSGAWALVTQRGVTAPRWSGLRAVVSTHSVSQLSLIYLFKFRERGREGERGGETRLIGSLSYVPRLRTEPKTQAQALKGTQTSNHLLCRTMSNPLNHTSQLS